MIQPSSTLTRISYNLCQIPHVWSFDDHGSGPRGPETLVIATHGADQLRSQLVPSRGPGLGPCWRAQQVPHVQLVLPTI